MPRVNNPYERQHIANLATYGRLIDAIYKQATLEAAAIASIIPNFDNSRLFSFDDYPITQERIQSLLSRLGNSVETAIVNGVNAEWTLANNKNNELSRRVFGDNIGRLTQAQYRRYFSTNDNARIAFLQRKEQGLNLSERVWRYTNEFKDEIELGLDVGIRNGLDAPDMARQLQQFLQHPDMLFRRVRDEHGNLVLSKRAADFHPGQGVYRSSYKNARRLAVTETNMAYRSADYERYQQLDFVVGIEIKLSNNHTVHDSKGNLVPLYDICDELQGRYPKDFKFTGWHPHCRCHVISILKTEAELMEENAAILRGEEPSEESVNRVNDVPQVFKDWVEMNTERVKYAQSLPYFILDNAHYVPKDFIDNVGYYSVKKSPSVVGDVIESLHKLIDPTYIRDKDVKELIMDFAGKNPALFKYGLGEVKITRAASADYFMGEFRTCEKASGVYLPKPSTIAIVDKQFPMSDGRMFAPLQDLKKAIQAIKEGRKLEFNEEYALESLWHEIRHAGAKGWSRANIATKETRNAMETINQFCARRSYGQLVTALGGKVRNQAEIIANGYGYNTSVANLNSILEYYGVKPQNLYRYFKDRIQTSYYEEIYEDLAQYLARNIGLSIDTIKNDLLRLALGTHDRRYPMNKDSFRIYLGF